MATVAVVAVSNPAVDAAIVNTAIQNPTIGRDRTCQIRRAVLGRGEDGYISTTKTTLERANAYARPRFL
jgi:hypothetical protein